MSKPVESITLIFDMKDGPNIVIFLDQITELVLRNELEDVEDQHVGEGWLQHRLTGKVSLALTGEVVF
jgi:hypothetical protein